MIHAKKRHKNICILNLFRNLDKNTTLMIKNLKSNTHESLLEASNYIQKIENRQRLNVACIDKITFEMGGGI